MAPNPFRSWRLLVLAALLLAGAGLGQRAAPAAAVVDDPEAYHVEIIYAIPSDGEDEGINEDGSIAASVKVAQAWLAEQTDGRTFRIATDGDQVEVTTVWLSRTDAELAAYGDTIADQIEYELLAQGYTDGSALYAVYYAGTPGEPGGCGYGPTPPNPPGTVIVQMLRSQNSAAEPCDDPLAGPDGPPARMEFGLMHELFHAVGAVPACAPHANGGHVDDIPEDLLYTGALDWNPTDLDLGRDDYYGHGRDDCLDAARSVFLDPPTDDAELPPVWFNGVLEQVACEALPSGTPSEGIVTTVYVINTTDQSTQLAFLHEDGTQELFGELAPWEEVTLQDVDGRDWLLLDENGDCLAGFTAPGQPSRVVLTSD